MIDANDTSGGNDIGSGGFAEERAQSTAGTGAAAAMQTDASSEVRQAEYVHNGMAFVDWFNQKLSLLTNPVVTLGTKQAQAIRLHPDGRLECVLTGVEDKGENQFVAFEPKYLDQLVRKIGAIGL